MKTILELIAALAVMTVAFGANQTTPLANTPKTGDKAPAVEGVDQDGKPWKLADFRDRKAVLLYFYPKDDTPGCTKQACGLRDQLADLKSKNVEVVGVSFDSPQSHKQFQSKYNLGFTLLADQNGMIADKFGARIDGRKMAKRVSFLIDRKGRIVHVTDNPDAQVHIDQMKEAAARLDAR